MSKIGQEPHGPPIRSHISSYRRGPPGLRAGPFVWPGYLSSGGGRMEVEAVVHHQLIEGWKTRRLIGQLVKLALHLTQKVGPFLSMVFPMKLKSLSL